jgi:hypothetical protein
VLRRLTTLPNLEVSRGNTDRYTLGDPFPHLTIAQAQADPTLVPRLVAAARVGAWAHGYLTGSGWIEWLAGLPLELRATLPDGTRLLGVHAAPGQDDGPGAPRSPSTSFAGGTPGDPRPACSRPARCGRLGRRRSRGAAWLRVARMELDLLR